MKKILLICIPFLMFSCGNYRQHEEKPEISENEHLVMATLWFQQSAEVKALFYQGYNIAKERLVQKAGLYDAPAVVLDLDETVLDNSPFEGHSILENKAFNSDSWSEWTDLARAKALPGALDFCLMADSLGVGVYYISNRTEDALEPSMANLKELGFPQVEEDHLLLKSNSSDKTERRNKVETKHQIILLIGDNLGDFDAVFDDRSENAFPQIEQHKDDFGNRFIMLPNPMYGAWSKTLIPKEAKTQEEKRQARYEKIIAY